MKNKILLLTLSIILCITIYSCIEKDSFVSSDLNTESSLVDGAKQYYSQKMKSRGLRTNSNDQKYKKIEPNWNKFKISNLSEGGDRILIVETDEFKINVEGTEFYRCYVFREQNNSIVDARIVEFLGNSQFLKTHKDDAIKNLRSKRIKDYTGVVITYDLDYQYLDGYSFKNGEREDMGVRLWVYSQKNSNLGRRITSTLRTQTEGAEDCEKIYWCYVWTNGAITNCVYSGNCEIGYNPNTQPPSGTPNQTTTTPSNGSIKNLLTDPCLTSSFNSTVAMNLNNTVQNILTNFNQAQALGFTIQEQNAPNVAADAWTSGKTITMNTASLQNASKEYVVATMYHEVLHVFLSGGESFEHSVMASGYIQPMKEALMAQFPNLGPWDAYALAWGGLYTYGAWNVLTQDARNDIIDINLRYQNKNNQYNHQYGSGCP